MTQEDIFSERLAALHNTIEREDVGLTEDQRKAVDQIGLLLQKPEWSHKACGIPKRYWSASFSIGRNPNGYLFHGPNGTGKTWNACGMLVSLANERILERVHSLILTDRDDRDAIVRLRKHLDVEIASRARFANAVEVLLELRGSFDRGNENKIMDRYSEVPILALDDLGAEQATDYARAALYSIITRRHDHMRPTIITTNLKFAELADIDPRIASRAAGFFRIECTGKDRRIQEAKECKATI